MNVLFGRLGLLLAGAALGAGSLYVIQSQPATGNLAKAEPQPLYWVAPMDPNYRRDKPGKSPMGMDLVAVYEEAGAAGPDAGPGTISISPEVVNNLGVRTAAVEQSALNFQVRTVGYVQYNQDKIIHIHPRVEGWVEKVAVTAAGEQVKQGQPLYSLYSPALVNAQEELLFGLARGDARLTAAAESRLRSLNVSPPTIARLKRERKPGQTVTFYAPTDGVVDDFSLREGLYVKPGMTLMSIGALDEVWVEAEVFERQASLVREGLPVQMRLDYLPGRQWQGEVDYVYPTLDTQTRTLRVRMRFANPDLQLRPNMFAEVTIQHPGEDLVLNVPREAVIRGGSQDRVVLALGEGRFKSVAVKTGRSDGRRMEILDGLAAGEQVVTSAQFLLDSESSKTSDFKRMHSAENDRMAAMSGLSDQAETQSEPPVSVWVEATVNRLDAEQLKINVDHAAVPEWNWPQMTMGFQLSEWVDLEGLKPGVKAQIEIEKLSTGGYQIRDVFLTPEAEPQGGGAIPEMTGNDHAGQTHKEAK